MKLDEVLRLWDAKAFHRRSKRNVPHLLVEILPGGNPGGSAGDDYYASVCFFGKSNLYRVFHPYRESRQEREDFSTADEVTQFLYALRSSMEVEAE